METAITLGLILATVFAVSYLVGKFGKFRVVSEDSLKFIRSYAFLNAYLAEDKTQDEFVGKSVDESITLGQDILWKAAGDFGKEFSESVVEPTDERIERAFATAVRIVKCVHTMHVIQKGGPLPAEPIIGVPSDEEEAT